MNWRVVIIDDERLARKELRSLLADYSDIEIVGEAENVKTAVALIHRTEPGLIFLDIQMPGASGFQLLEQIEPSIKVIFVTAFDNYAIRAFEVNALDYLLKPINPLRLTSALARLTNQLSLPASMVRKLEYTDRLFLEIGGRTQFLKLEEIAYIRAADDYSQVITTKGKTELVLKSLKEWEERLPEKYFVRIHRSTIINLEYVERIEDHFNRSYQIFLRHCNEPLQVSRRYASQLKHKFG